MGQHPPLLENMAKLLCWDFSTNKTHDKVQFSRGKTEIPSLVNRVITLCLFYQQKLVIYNNKDKYNLCNSFLSSSNFFLVSTKKPFHLFYLEYNVLLLTPNWSQSSKYFKVSRTSKFCFFAYYEVYWINQLNSDIYDLSI